MSFISTQEQSYPLNINIAKTAIGQTTVINRGIEQTIDQIQYSMPPFLTKILKTSARESAAILCSMDNLNTKRVGLENNKTNSTIPKHLEFKYKKLFTKDHQTNLKAATILAEIELEILEINDKINELNLIYEHRMETLNHKISSALQASKLNIDAKELKHQLDFETNCMRFQFLMKQKADQEKKAAKQIKFQEKLEKEQLESTFTNKEVTILKKTISKLQKDVKKLSTKASKPTKTTKPTKSGNVKRGTEKQTTKQKENKNKKSTGTTKESNGKRRNTAKNKKSHGKNGKQ